MILGLYSRFRAMFEKNQIKIKPYMTTKKDLEALGHAQCHYTWGETGCEEKPKWLVNGWACCDDHLAHTVRDAADFNYHHGIWPSVPGAN